MRTTLLQASPAATTGRPRDMLAWLRRLFSLHRPDDDERSLLGAHDLADLERRLRRLERGRQERFAPLPPGP